MQGTIGSLNHNAYRPVAPHAQDVARRAEMARAIRAHLDRIGPHTHILHSGIECYLDLIRRLTGAISHLHRKAICAGMIGGDDQEQSKIAIESPGCRVKRGNGSG